MPSHISPLTARLFELLQPEGSWHDLEKVRLELARAVPPGEAVRFMERTRDLKVMERKDKGLPVNKNTAQGNRVVQRSTEFLIGAGQRALALRAINALQRVERRTIEGRDEICLRPPLMHHRHRKRLEREGLL